jgi:hypothetical protein
MRYEDNKEQSVTHLFQRLLRDFWLGAQLCWAPRRARALRARARQSYGFPCPGRTDLGQDFLLISCLGY